LEYRPGQWDISRIDAVIRLEYGIDPENISQEDWIKYFNEWLFVQQVKADFITQAIKKALADE